MRKIRVAANKSSFYNNEYWMMALNFNGLFRISEENGECTFDSYISGEFRLGRGQYDTLVILENKIYFIPLIENKFVIYDIENREYMNLAIPDEYDSVVSFTGAVCDGTYIYTFGLQKWIIARIDTRDNSIEYYRIDCPEIKNEGWDKKSYLMGAKALLCNQELIIPARALNGIIIFNTVTFKSTFYSAETSGGFFSVARMGENYYMGPDSISNPIICMDSNFRKIKEIPVSDSREYSDNPVGLLSMDSYISVFTKEKIYSLDTPLSVCCDYNFEFTYSQNRLMIFNQSSKSMSVLIGNKREVLYPTIDDNSQVIRDLKTCKIDDVIALLGDDLAFFVELI